MLIRTNPIGLIELRKHGQGSTRADELDLCYFNFCKKCDQRGLPSTATWLVRWELCQTPMRIKREKMGELDADLNIAIRLHWWRLGSLRLVVCRGAVRRLAAPDLHRYRSGQSSDIWSTPLSSSFYQTSLLCGQIQKLLVNHCCFCPMGIYL